MQQEIDFDAPPKPRRSAFHWRKLEGSRPLRRLLALLLDGRMHSTLGIMRQAQICAVSAAVPELRCNGVKIECEHFSHMKSIAGDEELPAAYYYWIRHENLEAARKRLRDATPADEKQL